MFNVVLVEPEIPPNTGNVGRLCLATKSRLHLVKPLGFSLEDRQLKRAGLDYHEMTRVTVHAGWDECRAALADRRMFACTTKGMRIYSEIRYAKNDVFVFADAHIANFDR